MLSTKPNLLTDFFGSALVITVLETLQALITDASHCNRIECHVSFKFLSNTAVDAASKILGTQNRAIAPTEYDLQRESRCSLTFPKLWCSGKDCDQHAFHSSGSIKLATKFYRHG